MENKYNQVMKNIEVTSDMRDRILNKIGDMDFGKTSSKKISTRHYRQYLSIAACFIFLIVGTVALQNQFSRINNPPLQNEQGVMGIVDHNTMDDLSEAVGFRVKEIREVPFTVEKVQYTSYWGDLAEVTYAGKNNTVALRMAQLNEDVSGDYSEYSIVKQRVINGYDVTVKGNVDKFSLAIWQYDGFSYAVQFTEAVSEQELLAVIESLEQ